MKYGVAFSWWNSFKITCETAIQNAPSLPAWSGTHWSAYLQTWLKSGENTTALVPLWRDSAKKWQSGVRVIFRHAPISAIIFALYQSALSHTSVCSPQISGKAVGRSQYQS